MKRLRYTLHVTRYTLGRFCRGLSCHVSRVTCHAFTLVELIVVSALLMIVGGGLLTTFITGQTSYLSADAYVQVQQEARRAFDNMVRELREAGAETGQNITVTKVVGPPLDNSQLNFQIARGYNSEVGSLLTNPKGCQSPQPAICWGSENVTGEWVHYYKVGTGNSAQLIRWRDNDSTGGAPPAPGSCTVATACRVLANNVNSLKFIYSGAATKVITVTLQIKYNSPLLPAGSQATPKLTSQVKLRN